MTSRLAPPETPCGTVTTDIGYEYDKFDENGNRNPSRNGDHRTDLQSSAQNNFGDKIFGGARVHLGEVPWQVSLVLDGRSLACGGTIISKNVRSNKDYFSFTVYIQVVITAAHCFQGSKVASRWRVIAGNLNSSGAERRGIEKKIRRIVTHP